MVCRLYRPNHRTTFEPHRFWFGSLRLPFRRPEYPIQDRLNLGRFSFGVGQRVQESHIQTTVPSRLLGLQRSRITDRLPPRNVLSPEGVPPKTWIVQLQPFQDGPEFKPQQVPVVRRRHAILAEKN